MKKQVQEVVAIPDGVSCKVEKNILSCTHGNKTLKKEIHIIGALITVKDNSIVINSLRANRKTIASMRSFVAHVKNMFLGLEKSFVYEMEICNVHFPMTVKTEGNMFVISNFLGEKEKRVAQILPGVHVEVKGNKISVSSDDIESAGQTAANIEKATIILRRDRRVFQDGIFITSKCGRPI